MSPSEVAGWSALLCGVFAYVLPLIVWTKQRPEFPTALLVVPAATLLSWWVAESRSMFAEPVGITFYGALPAGVISDLVVFALFRAHRLRTRPIFWAIILTVFGAAMGAGLQFVLPGIPE